MRSSTSWSSRPRGSVLVGAVEVVVVDDVVVDVVPLVFFVAFAGLIFGTSSSWSSSSCRPWSRSSTSWAEASCCSMALMSAWYSDRSRAFSAACALVVVGLGRREDAREGGRHRAGRRPAARRRRQRHMRDVASTADSDVSIFTVPPRTAIDVLELRLRVRVVAAT